MPTILLQISLALVIGYVAWRHDRRDLPLALLRGYVALTGLGTAGLTHLWGLYADHSVLLRFGLAYPVDVLFVSWFAAHWVVAWRYHRGRWPRRPGFWCLVLAGGMLLVNGVHAIQRLCLGLGPWEVGARWVALNGSSLGCSVMAGYHLAQVLRRGEVTVAHLVLGLSTAISILQFLMALRPWAWSTELYSLALLVFLVVSLATYAVRLVWLSLSPRRTRR